jgi:ribosome biogenesis GTPase
MPVGGGDRAPARVVATHGESCVIVAEEGESSAVLSGRLQYFAASPADLPAVGDWVVTRHGVIDSVLPRRTAISRKGAGSRREEQILAANVDLVFIVSGLDHDFNLRRLERYLVVALESGATPVFVLNKADLCPAPGDALDAVGGIAAGSEVLLASAIAEEGTEQIRARLTEGVTGVLIGSSGAGKSTLVNCLLGAHAQPVNAVRESDSRGRHTTTHRQLFRLPGGGMLIDTPGLREIQLWALPESVGGAFPEIEMLARGCRFRDCRHAGEAGCAVAAAIEQGQLEESRLTSFHKLEREAQRFEREADPLAARQRKREIARMHRAQRRFYRE